MRTVLCAGCFDPLHYGHVIHLQEARAYGDRLVVALTSDMRVREEKGPSRPFYSWSRRAVMLRALRCVDDVVSHDGPRVFQTRFEMMPLASVIRIIRPAIYCKGIDYLDLELAERAALVEVGAKVRITRTEKLSSVDVISMLRGDGDRAIEEGGER